MSEASSCYGCVHLRYKGPGSITGVRDMMGGTSIPLREQDGQNGPGRYLCGKFGNADYPVAICSADEAPKEIAEGCKEAR